MVTREGIRRIAALSAIVIAGGALVACGDSSSTATDTAPAKGTSSDPSKESKSGSKGTGDGGLQPQGDESSGSPPSGDTAPLKVSGGGADQYRTEGGDNSIQNFGEESEESELEEAATVLHDYLVARAEEDWPAACAYLARTVTDQLDVLASRSGQFEGQDCAKILGTLTPPLPTAVRRESTIVDAGSLRLEDERAFLIYRGAENAGYAALMEREDGAWKVGALAATPIP